MKKTDLEKMKALKLTGQLKQAGAPARFGQAAAAAPDRRAQRKIDQAQGLVSFPVKLPQPLADRVRALAVAREANVNDVVAGLLEAGLQAGAK